MKKKFKSLLLYVFSCLLLTYCLSCNDVKAAEQYPERIISLGPVITDMICILDSQDRLVGVTSYCILPAISQQKEIVGTVMLVSIEKIIALRPDIVIASALTMQQQITELKKHGINVMKLGTPKTFLEICQSLLKIGELIGKNEKSIEIVKKAKGDVDKLRFLAKNLKKRKVFIQIGLKPLKTAGKDSFINEYIEFAGGNNIALNTIEGLFSREKVIQQNPDVIFIATMGSSKKAGAAAKKAWMEFKFLKACQNNEIHILDPDIVCSPTPIIFAQGLKTFYKYIHPKSNY
jgi:cobalamin transport system substrate-binding protein